MNPVNFTQAHLGMLLWAALIAASFFAAAQVNQAIDPVLLTALRLLVTAAFIAL
ncbi:EamA family transporter, partial [Pseudomonas sp. MWU13-2860]